MVSTIRHYTANYPVRSVLLQLICLVGLLSAYTGTAQSSDSTLSLDEAVKAAQLNDPWLVGNRHSQDAIESIMQWQQEKTITSLAEAFGRCIVIPSFFSFMDKRTLSFYRGTTQGITYRVAIPGELE